MLEKFHGQRSLRGYSPSGGKVGQTEHNSKSYFVFHIKTIATSTSSGPKDFPSLYVFSAMLWALM